MLSLEDSLRPPQRLGHPSHSLFTQVTKVFHRTGRDFGSESRQTMAQFARTVCVKKKRDVEKRFAHAPWVLPRAGHYSVTPDGQLPFLQHDLLVVTLHARPTGKGVCPPSAPSLCSSLHHPSYQDAYQARSCTLACFGNRQCRVRSPPPVSAVCLPSSLVLCPNPPPSYQQRTC